MRFRACQSSRQGDTATPTAVLLSSVREPTSATRGSGSCLPERAGGTEGQTHGLGASFPANPMGIRDLVSGIRRSTGVLVAPECHVCSVRSASGLAVERNGLPRRSARRHVLLLISFLSPFPLVVLIASRDNARHNTPFKPRHKTQVAGSRTLPFSSYFRLSFM
jgi:hypothetical protein